MPTKHKVHAIQYICRNGITTVCGKISIGSGTKDDPSSSVQYFYDQDDREFHATFHRASATCLRCLKELS